jgi:toxin-antitoxin system PIN domain toxin
MVYAFRDAAPEHQRIRAWLEAVLAADEPVGLSELVLSGFLRIVTSPRIFSPPTPLDDALEFVHALRDQPNAVILAPGARHWQIFEGLCRSARVKGNLVADAYLAALAVETGSELVTTDRDFSRFASLRWRHPLADPT